MCYNSECLYSQLLNHVCIIYFTYWWNVCGRHQLSAGVVNFLCNISNAQWPSGSGCGLLLRKANVQALVSSAIEKSRKICNRHIFLCLNMKYSCNETYLCDPYILFWRDDSLDFYLLHWKWTLKPFVGRMYFLVLFRTEHNGIVKCWVVLWCHILHCDVTVQRNCRTGSRRQNPLILVHKSAHKVIIYLQILILNPRHAK